MSQANPPQLSEAQRVEWVQQQFQRANKHLAENGVLFDSVITEESRYLVPFVAVWKIKALDNRFYWVLSGDLPSDFTLYENAKNVREALRYFSMTWQVKAENIRLAASKDKTQLAFADVLQARAENLYSMHASDDLWNQ